MRLQITVSDELGKKLDNIAKEIGTTKSTLCSVLLSQSVKSYDFSYQLMSDVFNKMDTKEMLTFMKGVNQGSK